MEQRVIKFRGKRVDNGEWVYGYYFIDLENKLPYIMLSERKNTAEDWMLKSVQVVPETVGQFIGLNDSDGDEIYEHDILCWPKYEGSVNETRWEVRWIEQDARFSNWSPRSGAKIIGTIFDNPEIITV